MSTKSADVLLVPCSGIGKVHGLLGREAVYRAVDELGKDEDIVIFCQTSVRAYQAQRILDGAGFKNVKFMEGSIAAWPYGISSTRASSKQQTIPSEA